MTTSLRSLLSKDTVAQQMICRKQMIVESETRSCLLACKVTVIHQKWSSAEPSTGSCGSATLRLCSKHQSWDAAAPPNLNQDSGQRVVVKPARTKKHAATHPSNRHTHMHAHSFTNTHTHTHTINSSLWETSRCLFVFSSCFFTLFFFSSLRFPGSVTRCASSPLPAWAPPLLSSAAVEWQGWRGAGWAGGVDQGMGWGCSEQFSSLR